MKTYWGSRGRGILDLSTRWRWLDGPQSHSGYGGEEKNTQPPPGIKP